MPNHHSWRKRLHFWAHSLNFKLMASMLPDYEVLKKEFFMKKFAILFFMALFSLSSLELKAESNSPFIDWCESYSDSTKQSKATSKPIVILFTGTNWCPACKRLEKSVLNNPKFIQAVNDKFLFY